MRNSFRAQMKMIRNQKIKFRIKIRDITIEQKRERQLLK